ncbi:hypothetical protein KUV56_16650 [Ferrimonas balearica]|uniref:hypothetical protein n=1 Tax=Ferrimonas balearica TaxID=44012 RepID=UPI001C5639BD|nr:hypothetical protein [Ferrimonas balearica]MBW3141127.1 hypothetical protein [Ferrimonas balearica]
MSFIGAVGQQWQKAQLSQRLQLALMPRPSLNYLFTGATDRETLSHLVAALVFSEGKPDWLVLDAEHERQPLSAWDTMDCLLLSCSLLSTRACSPEGLSQAEQLVMTLAEVWASELERHVDHGDAKRDGCQALLRFIAALKEQQQVRRQRSRNMTR